MKHRSGSSRFVSMLRLLSFCLLCLLVSTACGGAPDRAQELAPNVIVLLSDEHRWHSMGHTQMPELLTPELDRLAEQGASFSHAISNYPLCAPFRAMLLSGRWPYQTGVIDNGFALPSGEATLAGAFGAAGYATGYVGKLHLANWTATAFGFDSSIVWQDSDQHMGGRWTGAHKGEWQQNEGHYNASVMTGQALDFVERHRSEPFLLVLSWNPPHAVFTDAPESTRALYPQGKLSYRENYRDPPQLDSPFEVYRGYHAHISAIDSEVGRVMAALRALALERRTIVVYTSDHGSMQGANGLSNKRFPHDESIRIPFLVWAPGLVPAGTRIDSPIGAIDMAPTIAGLAGVPALPGWVGQDRSLELRGEAPPPPSSDSLAQFDGQPIMHLLDRRSEHLPPEQHTVPRYRGIRTGRWTYAVRSTGPWLLFDNDADPYQQHNLAGDPRHAATRRELADRIALWLDDAEDPFSLPANAWH